VNRGKWLLKWPQAADSDPPEGIVLMNVFQSGCSTVTPQRWTHRMVDLKKTQHIIFLCFMSRSGRYLLHTGRVWAEQAPKRAKTFSFNYCSHLPNTESEVQPTEVSHSVYDALFLPSRPLPEILNTSCDMLS